MIDQIREDIERRLEQLLAEADKLRDALSALGSGDGNGAAPAADGGRARPGVRAPRLARRAGPRASSTGAQAWPPSWTAASVRCAQRRRRRVGRANADSVGSHPAGRARSAGKAQGEPLTAGQVASSTGLGRPSVSTTLSKLARSGDVIKAQRGYAIAAGGQK